MRTSVRIAVLTDIRTAVATPPSPPDASVRTVVITDFVMTVVITES